LAFAEWLFPWTGPHCLRRVIDGRRRQQRWTSGIVGRPSDPAAGVTINCLPIALDQAQQRDRLHKKSKYPRLPGALTIAVQNPSQSAEAV
jgi:hypothetical protein